MTGQADSHAEGGGGARASREPLEDMSPRAQRLLLGNWNPVVRDPLDVLRLSLVGGAIYLAVTGQLGGAARMLGTAVVVFIPRWFDLPRPFDLGFILGMSLQAWGNAFNAFETFGWYDSLVHFVLTGFIATALYLGFAARSEHLLRPEDEVRAHDRPRLVAIVVAIGAVVDALYEAYEWAVDNFFGTNLNKGWADTGSDFGFAVAGSLAAGLLLLVWAHRGWGSARRVPREPA